MGDAGRSVGTLAVHQSTILRVTGVRGCRLAAARQLQSETTHLKPVASLAREGGGGLGFGLGMPPWRRTRGILCQLGKKTRRTGARCGTAGKPAKLSSS